LMWCVGIKAVAADDAMRLYGFCALVPISFLRFRNAQSIRPDMAAQRSGRVERPFNERKRRS